MGIFEIKIYVNVCRFLSNYFCFSHLTASFHISWLPFHIFLRTKKSAISGTLLNEDGDIALRMLSVNLFT